MDLVAFSPKRQPSTIGLKLDSQTPGDGAGSGAAAQPKSRVPPELPSVKMVIMLASGSAQALNMRFLSAAWLACFCKALNIVATRSSRPLTLAST